MRMGVAAALVLTASTVAFRTQEDKAPYRAAEELMYGHLRKKPEK